MPGRNGWFPICDFLCGRFLANLRPVSATDSKANDGIQSAGRAPGTFTPDEISRMRREYARGGLQREDLNCDPFAQFEIWFMQACEAGLLEPNAMSLATASPEGQPTLRTVLLKQFDHRGFVFFTNLESTKAKQLTVNPQASLLFPWLALERQVIILGAVERISTGEVLKYFVSRPFGSQLAAWSSPQSSVITSRGLLEMKFEEMKRKFSEGKVPLPSFWGGYRVLPRSFEFWQGRPNRLHDRFLYSREGGKNDWKLERLAP
jgi:pyridoxamine 5'-phosphate oxidase